MWQKTKTTVYKKIFALLEPITIQAQSTFIFIKPYADDALKLAKQAVIWLQNDGVVGASAYAREMNIYIRKTCGLDIFQLIEHVYTQVMRVHNILKKPHPFHPIVIPGWVVPTFTIDVEKNHNNYTKFLWRCL
jgi:hypothetical protein